MSAASWPTSSGLVKPAAGDELLNALADGVDPLRSAVVPDGLASVVEVDPLSGGEPREHSGDDLYEQPLGCVAAL